MGADNKPSETPLTNAICALYFHDGGPAPAAPDTWVCLERAAGQIAEHARQLERSNVALRGALEHIANAWGGVGVGDDDADTLQRIARAALQGGK